MKRSRLMLIAISLVLLLGLTATAFAQSTASGANSNGSVPSLINYSGVLKDSTGKALTSISGVTFSIYQDEEGGSPVWLETQNVTPDPSGRYTVQLGATSGSGLPSDLFQSGEARWLGVQVQGQAEQPRVMLLSVPYAMKASDAQTLGGLPASAFVQANSPGAAGKGKSSPGVETQNFIPLFIDNSGDLGNSILFQSGTSAVGIGTTTPTATLEVNGTAQFDGLVGFAPAQTFPGTLSGITAGTGINVTGSKSNPTVSINTTFANEFYPQLNAANTFTKSQTVEGTMTATTFAGSGSSLTNVNAAALNGLSSTAFGQLALSNTYQSSPLGTAIPQVLAPVNNATASAGFNSNPFDLAASSFNSTANAAQKELFRWQTEPAGNNTGSPSGTLNLLFAANGATPTETGLNIASNGQITFAKNQTFPGTGTGTITGVTAGSGLSGGGTSGTVTLTNSGILSLTAGSGIVTSGGQTPTISNSGVLNLTAGTGLNSTGGQSPTLSINTSVVPELGTANTFTANLATTGELAAGGAPSHNIANGTVEVDAANTNTGSYLPGLIFGGGGESISSNRAGTTNLDGIDFYTKKIPRMSLTNGGQFGINTATPSHLFEVDAAATVAQMAMVSSGTDAAISVKNTATGGREYWIDSGSGNAGIGAGNFAVYDVTAGLTRFVIGPTGNVGIGTTTPSGSLEVNSNSTFGIFASGGSTTLAAVGGSANATTGAAWGVQGYSASDAADAYGVYGYAGNTGASSEAVGVYGQSVGGEGVGTFGQYGLTESGTGQSDSGASAGLWGDAGPAGNVAVLGTADAGIGGFFENNSSGFGIFALEALANNPEGEVFAAYNAATGGICQVDNIADFTCTGQIGASVPLDGGERQVAVSAIQSPKNWFEDAGEAQLSNGRAVVTLDSDFTQTVNTNEKYEVFLTPYGDCKGLYVTNRTANSFEVHELDGGGANVSFGFRIMALRKNYENIRFADRTAEMQKLREQNQRMHARKGSGQSHDPRRSPLLKPASQHAELRPAAVK